MRLERRHEPLVSRRGFVLRLLRYGLLSAGMIFGSLVIGTAGYRWFGGLEWIDALLNAAFILTGMGPVNSMTSTAGKFFATAYALFSGVVFLTSAGVLLAPAVHRFFHHFHLELDESVKRRAEH
jgi:hypothetical protein